MLIFCFFFSFSLSAKKQPTNKKQNKNKSCKTERLYVKNEFGIHQHYLKSDYIVWQSRTNFI